jgi:thiol:disulfide interchange protein DsbC
MRKIFAALALTGTIGAFACPTLSQFDKAFHSLINNPNLVVLKVEPSPIKGLCQAVIEIKELNRKIVLYTDESGKYLLIPAHGLVNVIDLQAKENLTQKTLEEINKFSKNQVKELDKYVAFTYGKKGKVVYLFTDPECPFCQRLEPTLKKLADEGLIQIKVILFPLSFHPHAKEKATAIVCQNIGWKGLQRGYWTEEKMKNLEKWQCKTGEELVKKSTEIAKKYGINGTPTMITEDGKKIEGALPESLLKKELKLESQKNAK